MQVTIDPKARPCPGVERAIALAEDILRRGEPLFAAGPLIHNGREVERLRGLGMEIVPPDAFADRAGRKRLSGHAFVLRAHGETETMARRARACGMRLIDATCPIVRHSQDLVEQHAREGWRVVITGNPEHPEVRGLLARAGENGAVVKDAAAAAVLDPENRSLLLAQSTVDPALFAEVRRILSGRLPGLKIMDTVCRFLRNRQADLTAFAPTQDAMIVIAGRESSNGRLLYETAKAANRNTFHVEGPGDLKPALFKNGLRVGVSGGASTPRWQLEEMRLFLENLENNPKGLKNKKGGTWLWWMWKKTKWTT